MNKHIPDEFIKEYVDKLIEDGFKFGPESIIGKNALKAAMNIMEMVIIFRQTNKWNGK